MVPATTLARTDTESGPCDPAGSSGGQQGQRLAVDGADDGEVAVVERGDLGLAQAFAGHDDRRVDVSKVQRRMRTFEVGRPEQVRLRWACVSALSPRTPAGANAPAGPPSSPSAHACERSSERAPSRRRSAGRLPTSVSEPPNEEPRNGSHRVDSGRMGVDPGGSFVALPTVVSTQPVSTIQRALRPSAVEAGHSAIRPTGRPRPSARLPRDSDDPRLAHPLDASSGWVDPERHRVGTRWARPVARSVLRPLPTLVARPVGHGDPR